ncbi:MAG: S1/P1 nuclease [Thalassolituus sp.]
MSKKHVFVFRSYSLLTLVGLFGLLLLPGQVNAFSFKAHEVICELAYQQVEADVQGKIDALVKQSPETSFGRLCGWPDKIRDQDEYKHTKTWHYVNLRRGAESVKASDCAESGCVISAIDTMAQRLELAPDSDWKALAFLGHFVGDIHQPMHVSYADDRGGNRTQLYYEGEKTNLHYLWDREVAGLTGTLSKNLALIGSFERYKRKTDRELVRTPLDMANESYARTRNIYAKYRRGMRLKEDDLTADRQWLRVQMIYASERLALQLSNVLK